MRPDQLRNYLDQLLSDPSRKDNPSFRLALEATGGFVSFERGENRPHLDKDAAALFTIMVHCVQRSWLNLFAEINRTHTLAMGLLGVLAALGKSEIESRVIGKIQQIVGSDDAVRCLQAHLLMAVQIWLAGQRELDSAFKLADAVTRM
ncbi:hypothetical protein PRZ48_011555 [Zasmidium cellare]|uniref:Uncharacterized protein n=1 Tax=Zasmidium cellare TaxID=395010 RepID=A0ABR0E6P0_ZASCE|nr:hypothetical protein PRZ48_011555 [Zasmidium cellare]